MLDLNLSRDGNARGLRAKEIVTLYHRTTLYGSCTKRYEVKFVVIILFSPVLDGVFLDGLMIGFLSSCRHLHIKYIDTNTFCIIRNDASRNPHLHRRKR